jgi:D-glycero-D-manno-heptose 1,7-bisphosphate phosphatase
MSMPAIHEPVVTEEGHAPAAAPARVRRAVFLDRDGVVNVNHGYVHSAAETQWVNGIFTLARTARSAGYALVVVTNQAGIGRGYYTSDDFVAYTKWVHGEFAAHGAPLLATYYCPHHPTEGVGAFRTECECRKPQPGMLLKAAAQWNIDLRSSMLLGDHVSDIAAAAAAGLGLAALVRSGELAPALDHIQALAQGARTS